MSRNTTSYDSANAKDTNTYHIICTLVCTRAVNDEPEKTITCQIRYTCCRHSASLSELIVKVSLFLSKTPLPHPPAHRNRHNVDMGTTPVPSVATSAYNLVVKALEDKNAANAALAQAQSDLEDLKETLARARQAEHDADERELNLEYRLMDDLRGMGKKVNDREAHILQVYALLDSIADNWNLDRKHVQKCAKCENAATVRFMDCGHTLCTRGCGEKTCANCQLYLDSATCDNHVWNHACPVIDCHTPATAVVPLTGSPAATALSGLRPLLNQVVDYVNDHAGEMLVMQEELDQRMDDD
ncbi:hypothetical protein K523DRAFT_407877 [Schizophyllum commune Tattone D]|nr:hypothetical protein K523DRAFT_407877 [Schizophyllum commune Tattone D]